jgi:putative ABC transport system permease protein
MAIGAGRGPVLAMVLKQGLVLSLAGIAIGLLGSVAALRGLTAAISGVSGGADPVVWIVLPLALIAVTIAATLGPARRASLVDPVKALRTE